MFLGHNSKSYFIAVLDLSVILTAVQLPKIFEIDLRNSTYVHYGTFWRVWQDMLRTTPTGASPPAQLRVVVCWSVAWYSAVPDRQGYDSKF